MTDLINLDYDSNPSRFRANVESAKKYGLMADVHEEVAQRLAAETKHPILDMGCGEGRFIAPAIQAGLAVVALDYAVTMLRSISHKPVQGNACRLPFANNTFGGDCLVYALPFSRSANSYCRNLSRFATGWAFCCHRTQPLQRP